MENKMDSAEQEPLRAQNNPIDQDEELSEASAPDDGAAPQPDDSEGVPAVAEDLGPREWYVVHSYSGYENKVKKNLEQRIETMGMQGKIFRVVVPTEEEIEIRDGQRRSSHRRVFPGYILVEMVMDDESWYVVRNTPGVTGFVGLGAKPTPLSKEEVDKILQRMEAEQPRIKVSFRTGETVRIVEGPFADFMAVVDELYADRGKVRVLVSFFGRETPVEMDFLQVERI
jgi:transcriptional antiterminator NusG